MKLHYNEGGEGTSILGEPEPIVVQTTQHEGLLDRHLSTLKSSGSKGKGYLTIGDAKLHSKHRIGSEESIRSTDMRDLFDSGIGDGDN